MDGALKLTQADTAELERLASADDVRPRVARRAHLLLRRAAVSSDRETARQAGVSRATVTLWRRRYQSGGIAGLQDQPRASRPVRSLDASGTAVGLVDMTLERLLLAASRTISRRGFAATRVSDIAREANVSPATVHYYFKTRREILVQSLLWANERSLARMARAISANDPPLVRLAKFIERTIPYDGIQRDEYLIEIDLWSQARLHPDLLPAWETFGKRWIEHLRDILVEGEADRTFTLASSADVVAERIVAMTDGLSAHASLQASWMPLDHARDLVLQFTAEQVGIQQHALERHAYVEEITPPRTAPDRTAAGDSKPDLT